MEAIIREYQKCDLVALRRLWNEVVREGRAFPQREELTETAAADFFAAQSFTGVAVRGEELLGLYILHPNNVGRCGHLANASYAVSPKARGLGLGEKLVCHSLEMGRMLGFRILQFNAVVASNAAALHLYEKLGFTPLGTVPGGFENRNGMFEDIRLFYKTL